ncbi:hypothetical protein UM93_12625 [Psychromicrobium lacuslunae]|uniref:Uncharacterized protein n=1 Tax=Psychromicrobium lacuslunae TaxID=1618207 RepID=A0A0D4C0R6_9MICC|nr:hypothetical protein UM93_12625 [Psychromicrobium lacuslunae]
MTADSWLSAPRTASVDLASTEGGAEELAENGTGVAETVATAPELTTVRPLPSAEHAVIPSNIKALHRAT